MVGFCNKMENSQIHKDMDLNKLTGQGNDFNIDGGRKMLRKEQQKDLMVLMLMLSEKK